MKGIIIPYNVVDGKVFVCDWFIGRIVDCSNTIVSTMVGKEYHLICQMDVAACRVDCGHRRKIVNFPHSIWIMFVEANPQLWADSIITQPSQKPLPAEAKAQKPLEDVLAGTTELMAHEYYGDGILFAGLVRKLFTAFSKFIRNPQSLPNTAGLFCAGQFMRLYNTPSSPIFETIRIALGGSKLARARKLSPLPPELEKWPEPLPPSDQVPSQMALLVYYDGRMFAKRASDGDEYYTIKSQGRPDCMQLEPEPARIIRCQLPGFRYLWPAKFAERVVERRNCVGHDYFSPKFPKGIRMIWVDEGQFASCADTTLRDMLTPTEVPVNSPTDCPICLETTGAPLEAPCGHFFCSPCMHRWLDIHPGCPVCRQELVRTDLLDDMESWNELGAARLAVATYPVIMRAAHDIGGPVLSHLLKTFYRWQTSDIEEYNWQPTEVFEDGETGERLVSWSNLGLGEQRCLVTLTYEQAAELQVEYKLATLTVGPDHGRFNISRHLACVADKST